eukprot:jgi/Mesen1/7189/ME000371S06275
MGVPAFYRWLADKYPLIVVDVIEDTQQEIDGVKVPINTVEANPNGLEFDNLYLDMNGIIHPCFHPEDRAAPTTWIEVFDAIFEYIDRLFAMVRPRKVLYMAIDGVAPRAKMNQQRSRRFRAAKDAADAAEEEEKLRREFEAEGRIIPPKEKSDTVDSNVITPGTPFMAKLSIALQYYIHKRINEDPGEGEHKIMNFIRLQRNLPGYNPNTRHCLYGLDADLIMLGLATHEIHFSILREVVFQPGKADKCFLCGQEGHLAAQCEGKPKRKRGEHGEKEENVMRKPYQFLHIWILREYLEVELKVPGIDLDLERVVDDFVFMCFFVGNDFLPHMPTLEIREVNLKRVEHFIQAVGAYEETIFQKRARLHQRQMDRRKREKGQLRRGDDAAPTVSANALNAVAVRPNGRSNGSKSSNSSEKAAIDLSKCNMFDVLGNGVLGPGASQTPKLPANSHVVPCTTSKSKHSSVAGPESNNSASEGASAVGKYVRLYAEGDSPRPVQVKSGSTSNLSAAQMLREKLKNAATAGKGAVVVNAPAGTADVSSGKSTSPDKPGTTDGPAIKLMRVSKAGTGGEETDMEEEVEEEDEVLTDDGDDPVAAAAAAAAAALAKAEADEDAREELKDKLKQALRDKGDLLNSGEAPKDEVRLGHAGWKMRYYESKFGVKSVEEMEKVRQEVVLSFVEGLCWVMRYYYQGVCSWNWYYPYHYAPFASDLKDLHDLEILFDPGRPFKPFDQLMGVLPAASAGALPVKYRALMSDPNSPILDFYPTDFKVDMNGKRFAWQGVAMLPFIDEERLLNAIKPVEDSLTEEERRRNSFYCENMFIASSHTLAPFVFSLADRYGHLEGEERGKVKEPIDPAASKGTSGYMKLCGGDPCPPVLPSPMEGLPNIPNNEVLTFVFQNPDKHRHECKPLEGVKWPTKVVSEQDVRTQPLWHEDNGRRHQVQDRPPVEGALGGHHLGAAATRLLLNSLQHRGNSSGAAYNMVRQHHEQALQNIRHHNQATAGLAPMPTSGGGILNVPSPYGQPSGVYRGPPGYQQGPAPAVPYIPVPMPLQPPPGAYHQGPRGVLLDPLPKEGATFIGNSRFPLLLCHLSRWLAEGEVLLQTCALLDLKGQILATVTLH